MPRIHFPDAYFNALSIAPNKGEELRHLRITHPFHPLKDKQFELVEHRCIFGESYLYFYDDTGVLREIPAVWTDFLKVDVFVELAMGRSPLHAGTLLELAHLVERLGKELGDAT